MNATYRDLREFGLPLVTPADASFASLVRDIESRPQPFGAWPTGELAQAAVLLNQSGKAILGMAYEWRYSTAEGGKCTSRYSNLGSSTQLAAVTGRAGVVQDLGTFILPGSKRLITERGMFGNNLDVLPFDPSSCGGGYSGAGGGGRKATAGGETAAIELVLDLVILEDGRCVGPDETGLFESLLDGLERIRNAAQQAAASLRTGASPGQVFDMLRPLARHASPEAAPGEQRRSSPFLEMFGNMAIRQLVNRDSPEVAAWFEAQAQPPRLRLYRPS